MTDTEDENYEALVLQRADDAVIADAVSPELTQGALKPLSDLSGVVQSFDALLEEIQDSAGDRLVQLR